MALTGCKKDPQPEPTPEPEPQTVSRIASYVVKTNPNGMPMTMTRNYTWENGVLVQTVDSIITSFMGPVVTAERYIYENGLLVKKEETSGKWQHHLTYEDGLLKTFVDINIEHNDTLYSGEILSYTANDEVEDVIVDLGEKKNKYHFTWENGDAVQVVKYVIYPEEEADTAVANYTFDNKHCPFIGIPLGAELSSDVSFIIERQSKHNFIDSEYTYTYDDQDRLVSKVKENDTTTYQYIEQTIR